MSAHPTKPKKNLNFGGEEAGVVLDCDEFYTYCQQRSNTYMSSPSSSTHTPPSPYTPSPSSSTYIPSSSSPYTPSPSSFTRTPSSPYTPSPSSSTRTPSSPYTPSPSSSTRTPPSPYTPSPSSSLDIPSQPSRREQIKTAVHLSLSNGSEDSTWSYDNESFIKLSAKWNSIESDNLLSKATLLLDDYLGIDENGSSSWMSFFYTSRNHYSVVKDIKEQCEGKKIKTVLDLLENLIAIKRDPEGLLQTTIAVIASKEFSDEILLKESTDINAMFIKLSPFNM